MRITNDDYKPDLDDDTLEHYGVMGMKWGVRRDQRSLDRAAGRALTPGVGRGKQIRDARGNVSTSKDKVKKAHRNKTSANEKLNRAKNSNKDREDLKKLEAQVKTATKKFNEASKSFENNPNRVISAKMTYGEMVVSAILLSPLTTAGLVAATETRSKNRKEAIRRNS